MNLKKKPKLSQLILATTNKGKEDEFNQALKDLNIEITRIGDTFECEENGLTFLDNAILKAVKGSKITEKFCLADDSGLCVSALNGEPGVLSARYFDGGKGIQKILSRMTDIGDRAAYFICSLALSDPNGRVIWTTERKWSGKITYEAKGDKGFGYDPIFIPDTLNCTVAEMNAEDKIKLSHRGMAISDLVNYLWE
jgi:XTP/dITP diphosphohydrolase